MWILNGHGHGVSLLIIVCFTQYCRIAGVPIALGSDFNPNAHCFSMPRVMNLACVLMRMTMNEALVASTINAAG